MTRPGPHTEPPSAPPAVRRPAYGDLHLSDGRVASATVASGRRVAHGGRLHRPSIALFCMMPTGYTTALARDFIADAPRAWAQDGWLHLALATADAERPIGAVGALLADSRPAGADLGYWVMPEHRGRGLGARGRLAAHWLGLRDARPAPTLDRHDGGERALAAHRAVARLPARGAAAQRPALRRDPHRLRRLLAPRR